MSGKKLNLNKYAYLDYLKGDVFAWLTCNENYQKAAKEDKVLRDTTPWRYDDPEDEMELEENSHERYGKDAPTPDQILAGLRVGEYSEIWAKNKWPNHKVVNVNLNTNLENIEMTKSALENDNVIIFEGTFTYKNFYIRTDILVKTGNEIKVIEVKATSSPKEVHAFDIFFQREIIERGNDNYKGWDYSLLILNKQYIHNQDWNNKELRHKVAEGVFINIDYTTNGTLSERKPEGEDYKVKWSHSNNIHFFNNLDNTQEYPAFVDKRGRAKNFTFPITQFFESSLVEKLQKNFDTDLERIAEIQMLDEAPSLEFEDRNNKFMNSDYFNWALNNSGVYDVEGMSVFDLRKINFTTKVKLMKEGKLDVDNVNVSDISPKVFQDDKYNTKETDGLIKSFIEMGMPNKKTSSYNGIIQKHFYNKEDSLIHEQGIKMELSKYNEGPIYMYDFETANLAIPFAEGTAPYEQVVYQYSIHVILDPNNFDFETNKNVLHYEWLAQDKKTFHIDAWKNFIEVFKTHGKGTYVAWNKSFEQGCISRAQTDLLNDLEKDLLDEIRTETEDLMLAFQNKYYYHKELKGSYSIKYAGPHFAPEINYKNLNNVQKGDQSAAVAKKWLRLNSEEGDAEWEGMRSDMLKYCEYDTLLMVAIFQRMKERLL